MYGSGVGTLRVKLCDAVIFEKTGDQGNQWKMQTIRRLQGSGSKEVRTKTRFPIFFFFQLSFLKISKLMSYQVPVNSMNFIKGFGDVFNELFSLKPLKKKAFFNLQWLFVMGGGGMIWP